MGEFRTLNWFFSKYKGRYIGGILCLLAVDILQLVMPRLLGLITDGLQQNNMTYATLGWYAIIIVIIAVAIMILRYIWRLLIVGGSRLLEKELRDRFFAHLTTLSPRYYNMHKTGDLMAHASNDINAIRMFVGQGIVMATDSLFMIIASLIVVFATIDWRLSMLALIPFPLMAASVLIAGRFIRERFEEVQRAFSNLTDTVEENFTGIRVIKAFVQEKAELKKFAKANKHNMDMNMRMVKVWGIMEPLMQFLSALSFIIVLYYGGMMVINGEITMGQFVSFNAYLGMLIWPVIAIGWVVNMAQRGTASMKRVNVIMNERPEIYDDNPADIDEIYGDIEYKDLTFRYEPNLPPALTDINISVKRGETLAIVGRTGSGKTTLINVLLRLYKVEDGHVFIDDTDINRIPLGILRESIGYVPQDNFLFSTTITENIAFGVDNYTMEQVEQAARIAQLYDDVMDFPDKFNTIVGERGVSLSGGQKQRVSIARAIMKDPKILILDDSLSAVDTDTEERILKGLSKVRKNRTTIIIAHRISAVKDADQIIALDEGRIVQRGTHGQLIQQEGLYKELYEMQKLEEELERTQ
ncbi:ABC transporter ATP-binding protein [Mahella australiensis]|uniref:ABC transporter related protein n=1 Tax=Mahella australiensis (strain DSM 15567 / CIP 107919 / 50-1 BON) TaxID=697281 RepID=F3ZXL8_MAHA5|nr:ABC transporter ATP-binding protein [Mahella australiensis]AEE95525.1 ABC transporter related protein [Mahella australiensis 50-1 BON]